MLDSPPPAAVSATTESLRARASDIGGRQRRQAALALLRCVLLEEFPGRVAVVSSFGVESALILSLVAEIDAATPVVFLETGKHFPETLAYREKLARYLGLSDVRDILPDPVELAANDPDGDLWQKSTDACCGIRKVVPLSRALSGFDAWITGRKRHHGGERRDLSLVEASEGRFKINPLVDWSAEEIAAEFRARRLPLHPLALQGYKSVGCAPCTQQTKDGEDARSGRWAGSEKTECGIHRAPWF
ncbi:MAG TPA: phosphoadenylyl-sulfate reductase [Dongiaceae bacterium]|jgi:phosphoadenosine phosphosulfate reductase